MSQELISSYVDMFPLEWQEPLRKHIAGAAFVYNQDTDISQIKPTFAHEYIVLVEIHLEQMDTPIIIRTLRAGAIFHYKLTIVNDFPSVVTSHGYIEYMDSGVLVRKGELPVKWSQDGYTFSFMRNCQYHSYLAPAHAYRKSHEWIINSTTRRKKYFAELHPIFSCKAITTCGVGFGCYKLCID